MWLSCDNHWWTIVLHISNCHVKMNVYISWQRSCLLMQQYKITGVTKSWEGGYRHVTGVLILAYWCNCCSVLVPSIWRHVTLECVDIIETYCVFVRESREEELHWVFVHTFVCSRYTSFGAYVWTVLSQPAYSLQRDETRGSEQWLPWE